MSETSARHFCHNSPEAGNKRRNHKGGLVPHTAGAVLVAGKAAEIRQIKTLSRQSHAFGKIHRFPFGHALKIYGHKQSRGLIIGNTAVGIPLYKELDLFL